MRHPILILVGFLMVSACSGDVPAQETAADPITQVADETTRDPVAKAAPIFGNRQEKNYIEAMEEGMESQMKLYARVSPEAAAKIKPVIFNAADRDVIRCSFNGMKRAGLSAYLDAGLETNKALNKAIDDNPDLSIRTLEQYPEIMTMMQGGDMMENMSDADQDTVMMINKDCGVIDMMVKKMTDSGVMAAMGGISAD
jgi:hypothetical protein